MDTLFVIGKPPTVPERTPENFVCLRGPCRHFWHLVTMAQEGNPEGTFDHPLKQHHYTCLVHPGVETDFGDDNAYECNRWDPLTPHEIRLIQDRRNQYLKESGATHEHESS